MMRRQTCEQFNSNTPSNHGCVLFVVVFRLLFRYANRICVRTEWHVPIQRQNRNVVGVRFVVVLFVRWNFDHVVSTVVLVLFLYIVGANANKDVLWLNFRHAMTRGQHMAPCDQCSAAKLVFVGGGAEDRYRPRPGIFFRFFASDNSGFRWVSTIWKKTKLFD